MPTSLCPGPGEQWAFSQKHEHFYRQISHQLIKAYGALPALHKIVCNAWLLCGNLSGFPLPNSLSSSWYLENPIPIINCGPSDLGELFRLGSYDSQLDIQWYSHTRVWNYILGNKTNAFFPPLSRSDGGNLTPVNCICSHFWLFQHTESLMGKDLSP